MLEVPLFDSLDMTSNTDQLRKETLYEKKKNRHQDNRKRVCVQMHVKVCHSNDLKYEQEYYTNRTIQFIFIVDCFVHHL